LIAPYVGWSWTGQDDGELGKDQGEPGKDQGEPGKDQGEQTKKNHDEWVNRKAQVHALISSALVDPHPHSGDRGKDQGEQTKKNHDEWVNRKAQVHALISSAAISNRSPPTIQVNGAAHWATQLRELQKTKNGWSQAI
jgi:hypothetical protein